MNLDILKEELTRDEKRVAHAYPDSEGYLTIGIGHLVDPRLGGRLDEAVIDYQYEKDIDRVCRLLDANCAWWRSLDDVRQRVMANLCFNLGARLFGFHKFLSAMETGNFEQAANELVDSLWHKQVGARAIRLEGMVRKGTV